MRFLWVVVFVFACGKGGTDQGPASDDKKVVDKCAGSPSCKLTGACAENVQGRTDVEEFGNKGIDVKHTVSVTCVPATDAHCKQAQFCKERGECSLSPKAARCVVGSDADCKGSDQCKDNGFCAKDPTGASEYCIVASDADCAASKMCTENGECTKGNAGTCVAKSDAECKAAPGCKKNGLCGLLNGICAPTKMAHCEQSDACKTEGRCRPNPSMCIK